MNPVSLQRASSAASADPLPLDTFNSNHTLVASNRTGGGHHRSNSTGSYIHHHHQSSFKNCLKPIPVPSELQKGIPCVRVYANGKTSQVYLTLSADKFTLYISSQPLHKNGAAENSTKRKGVFSLLRRSSSGADSGAPLSGSGTNGANAGGTLSTSLRKSNSGQNETRAIDIGAVHRIQRGHANRRFEMLK
jgi:hypothetical protein